MTIDADSRVAGLLLAAGSGSRMGRPKALVRDDRGRSWIGRALDLLLDTGCDPVVVVLGAEADDARPLVPRDDRIRVVLADDWAAGMSASLGAGLRALERTDAASALITLVDLPGLHADALLRVRAPGGGASALRQATYAGRPGHPVLIGRDHWPRVLREISGDSGARDYLAAHDAERIECLDLWHGRDVDRLR